MLNGDGNGCGVRERKLLCVFDRSSAATQIRVIGLNFGVAGDPSRKNNSDHESNILYLNHLQRNLPWP